MMRTLLVVAAGLALAANAQAQDIRSERTVSMALAHDIALEAVKSCTAQGYKVTAVVVDRVGRMTALLRGDDAQQHSVDLARRKAYTAAMLRYDTGTLVANVAKGTTPAAIGNTEGFTVLIGGVPIKAGEEVIGGLGVSGAPGGPLDLACAEAALKSVAGRL
jgi:uncharacterized protein GlcG (DUF336 family)